MPQKNQHKSCRLSFLSSFCHPINVLIFLAPEEVIRGPTTSYFEMGVSDVDILKYLKFHYDTEAHGLR
jgi:hypothetical protein